LRLIALALNYGKLVSVSNTMGEGFCSPLLKCIQLWWLQLLKC